MFTRLLVLSLLMVAVFGLVLALGSGPSAAQGPQRTPCGDQICDEAEQANPNLCPQDCPDAAPNGQPPLIRPTVDAIGERAEVPTVTAIETWQRISYPADPGPFAPDIIALAEGGYRVFWNQFNPNGPMGGGIASASSPDGIHFTADEGLRLVNELEGISCVVSHPWIIAVEGGYRLYFQADGACRFNGDVSGDEPEFRILSAFSSDGLNFEREDGVRMDIGEATGLSQAAHGRVFQLADGTYRMLFSGNIIGKRGPSDILGATSMDGLTWTRDEQPIMEGGHDPAVIEQDGVYAAYVSYKAGNLLLMTSSDGYEFNPTAWVEFVDEQGDPLPVHGDVEVIEIDGVVYLYGSGKGEPLGIFVKVAE